jgi:hypothetical protein
METNVKMVHVPLHYDVEKKEIERVLVEWAFNLDKIDFTNISVYNLTLTFIGKFRENLDE